MVNLVFNLPVSLQQRTYFLLATDIWTKDGRWKHTEEAPGTDRYLLATTGLDRFPPSMSQKPTQKLISMFLSIDSSLDTVSSSGFGSNAKCFPSSSIPISLLGKPWLLCRSQPNFYLTGGRTTAQQPGWLHWRGHHASWAGAGHQEVVAGWRGASLLRQSCRVPAQWLGILVRLIGDGEGWSARHILGERVPSLKSQALKAAGPGLNSACVPIFVRLQQCFIVHWI